MGVPATSMRRLLLPILTLAALVFGFIPALVSAGAITQGYKAASELPKGAIVSLTKTGSQEVEKSNINNDTLLVGVVVDAPDSLLDVLPAGSEVRVAISGDVTMLVSTVNGDVKAGSRLIASRLSGIATIDYPPAPGVKYIAVANSDFSSTSKDAKKIAVTQNDGTTKDVYVGSIGAKLLLGSRTPGISEDRSVLTKIGRQLSGKAVSGLQVLAAAAVFLTTLGLAAMVLYSSIKGSFISIGRNPLSEGSIMNGLVKVIALSILIFGAGVVAAYLILQF